MSIQGAINQGIGLTAALRTQTPGYKAKQAEKIAEVEYEKADKALKTITKEPSHSTPPEILKDTLTRRTDAARKAFNENPTAENLQRATGAQNVSNFSDKMERMYSPETLMNNPALLKIVQARMRALQESEMKRDNKVEQQAQIKNNIDNWGEINGKK